jgi:hypothetical protein
MGGSIFFNWPEGDVCLLISRRSSSGRSTFSLLLLEELAPACHHVERCNPRFGEDGAVGLVAILAMDGVGMFGRQARDVAVSRAAGSGSEMEMGD